MKHYGRHQSIYTLSDRKKTNSLLWLKFYSFIPGEIELGFQRFATDENALKNFSLVSGKRVLKF